MKQTGQYKTPYTVWERKNLVLQLTKESQIKSRTLMSCDSLYRLFCPKEIFLTFIFLSQCMVY